MKKKHWTLRIFKKYSNYLIWLFLLSSIKCCVGFPICDNSLLHGTAPVPAAPHAAPYHSAPAWSGAHSYAYQSAPAYNHWSAPAYNHYDEFSTNDISGPGGDK